MSKASGINIEEIDLREFVLVLYRGRLLIAIFSVLIALLSYSYSLTIDDEYRAETILIPTEDSYSSGLSQMNSSLGAINSLVGGSLLQSKTDKVTIALEILKTRLFLTNFIEKYELKPLIFAVESWSQEDGIKFNSQLYDPQTASWNVDENGRNTEPSSGQVYSVLSDEYFSIERNSGTGLVKLSVLHKSPKVAKQLVDLVIREVNNQMRERDINQARIDLEFLNRELQKTDLINMKEVFYSLIEQQTQKMMLASTREDYVFQVLDPAVIPEHKATPNRLLFLIGGFIIGAVLAVIFIIVKQSLSNFKRK